MRLLNHLGLDPYFIYSLEGQGGSLNPTIIPFIGGLSFDFWSLWYQENPDSGKNRAAQAVAVGSAGEKSDDGRGSASDGAGSCGLLGWGSGQGLRACALETGGTLELVEQTCNRDHSG